MREKPLAIRLTQTIWSSSTNTLWKRNRAGCSFTTRSLPSRLATFSKGFWVTERSWSGTTQGRHISLRQATASKRPHECSMKEGRLGSRSFVKSEGVAVVGELWEVNDETLSILDEVEGVPAWFQRRAITLGNASRCKRISRQRNLHWREDWDVG